MERQCAWCLCLMDECGEPVSIPRPKDYTVSHGMCRACGSLWLRQVLDEDDELTNIAAYEIIEEEA